MNWKFAPALAAALLLAACGGGENVNQTPPSATGTGTGDLASAAPSAPGSSSMGGITSQAEATAQLQSIGNTVYFATDSYSLDAQSQALLQKQAAFLKLNPSHAITIEGHADERGTREYNLALGDRRAQSVVNYLVALGIDPQRLKEISYGKERPICADSTEACWAQNRRAITTLDN